MSDYSTGALVKDIQRQLLEAVQDSRRRLQEALGKGRGARPAPASGGPLSKRAVGDGYDAPISSDGYDAPISSECGVPDLVARRRRMLKKCLANPISVIPGASPRGGRR